MRGSYDRLLQGESDSGVQFTSLHISSTQDPIYPGDNYAFSKRTSWWRWWKQRSRLQRTLIYLVAALVLIAMILLLPSASSGPNTSSGSLGDNKLLINNQKRIQPNEPSPLLQIENPEPPLSDNEMPKIDEDKQIPKPKKNNGAENDEYSGIEKLVSRRDKCINVDGDYVTYHSDGSVRMQGVVDSLDDAKVNGGIFKGPQNERQRAVVKAFKHAWSGYKEFAWGHDHLKPLTKTYHDWFGLALTILDSLDTLYIMNLEDEFQEARTFVAEQLDLNVNKDVNLFETTIRVLGGLLSAYHLSKDEMFLKKAVELGDLLLPAFNSASGVPYSDINLYTHHAHAPRWGPDSSVSEVATVQLEFKDLAHITGDNKYENAANKVTELIHKLPKTDGLVPIYINADTGKFRPYATITLGARGDSYYEYLLKQWLQTGKSQDHDAIPMLECSGHVLSMVEAAWKRIGDYHESYLIANFSTSLVKDYNESIAGILKHLVKLSEPSKLVFVGELTSGKNFRPKMDHLVCYLPSVLALGTHNGLSSSHLQLAENLIYTCYQMYAQMPTFLSPEIAHFNMISSSEPDIFVKINDAHNLLRPETVESLWYLYQLTRNQTYQEWGWQIFQAFEKYTKVESGGYTTIDNVKNVHDTRPRDMMESFFLSETLKYLYLLFEDDQSVLSLDKYVFNSEAHPLPIHKSAPTAS